MVARRLPPFLALAPTLALALASAPTSGGNRVAFIEPAYIDPRNDTTGALARIRAAVAAHGPASAAPGVSRLSLVAWPGDLAPSPESPLPPPDAGVVAFLAAARAAAPGLRAWVGVSVCPGPEYTCMLNYTNSAFVGAALGAAVLAAGLDGVQLYASPYCNNADCKKTTGKYAVGIAAMMTAFRAACAGCEVAMLLNEWDRVDIVHASGPAALFSYQTIFYPTATDDCVRDAHEDCGAGENVADVARAGANWTATLRTLAGRNISWLQVPTVHNRPPHSQTLTNTPMRIAHAQSSAAGSCTAAPLSQRTTRRTTGRRSRRTRQLRLSYLRVLLQSSSANPPTPRLREASPRRPWPARRP